MLVVHGLTGMDHAEPGSVSDVCKTVDFFVVY